MKSQKSIKVTILIGVMIFFALLFFLMGCSPVQKIRMNYVVNLADHGAVLCNRYTIQNDTIYLWDAGKFLNRKYQSRVSDCKAVGFDEVLIVEIK